MNKICKILFELSLITDLQYDYSCREEKSRCLKKVVLRPKLKNVILNCLK